MKHTFVKLIIFAFEFFLQSDFNYIILDCKIDIFSEVSISRRRIFFYLFLASKMKYSIIITFYLSFFDTSYISYKRFTKSDTFLQRINENAIRNHILDDTY